MFKVLQLTRQALVHFVFVELKFILLKLLGFHSHELCIVVVFD